MALPFIEHIEQTLGKIECGWKDDWPFFVLRFTGGPIADCCTFVTLGLSDHVFKAANSEKQMRQELVLMARSEWKSRNIPGILHQVGMELLATHRPLLRGQVIGPRGELFERTQMQSLYVTAPCYLPESFAIYRAPNKDVRFFVWLVPITESETMFIARCGWKEFERQIGESDPDLLDFRRRSIA